MSSWSDAVKVTQEEKKSFEISALYSPYKLKEHDIMRSVFVEGQRSAMLRKLVVAFHVRDLFTKRSSSYYHSENLISEHRRFLLI